MILGAGEVVGARFGEGRVEKAALEDHIRGHPVRVLQEQIFGDADRGSIVAGLQGVLENRRLGLDLDEAGGSPSSPNRRDGFQARPSPDVGGPPEALIEQGLGARPSSGTGVGVGGARLSSYLAIRMSIRCWKRPVAGNSRSRWRASSALCSLKRRSASRRTSLTAAELSSSSGSDERNLPPSQTPDKTTTAPLWRWPAGARRSCCGDDQ